LRLGGFAGVFFLAEFRRLKTAEARRCFIPVFFLLCDFAALPEFFFSQRRKGAKKTREISVNLPDLCYLCAIKTNRTQMTLIKLICADIYFSQSFAD